ncbi:MAG: cbb3-type cytochrome c oxidase subunit II [Armatimonadetes bacterium]|nr:cbb3-type cytochrome c oxidase subunit II [Armatimonadota bacterium]
MRMTPGLVLVGSVMVFSASTFAVIVVPWLGLREQAPSGIWRELKPEEEAGRRLYASNGCTYCHSQFVRTQDWDLGMERVSQEGDYVAQSPHLLGTSRTGPDLAQEGGEHPDDWHLAHFANPRNTRPQSLMPKFGWLKPEETRQLIAYVQSLGGRQADKRVARQKEWKAKAVAAYRAGADANIRWLHDHVPEPWRAMPNPYPATAGSLARGEKVYQDFCTGCHGPVGDGQGPSEAFMDPPPLNFTTLRRNLVEGKYIGGILYYQIMNGITGTAMPYFKHELESAKIWDVSNFIAVNFIGFDDSNTEPAGIDASYEPMRGERPASGKWSDEGQVDAP